MSAFDSLVGLSVGDAFGAQFFVMANRPLLLDETALPAAPWPWTDDTEMACNLLDVLQRHGQVERDALAAAFAGRYDPYRGYGPGTVVLLRALRDGEPWRTAATASHAASGDAAGLFDAVLAHTPPGQVHDGVRRAAGLSAVSREEAAYELGNGARVLAQDTVPFCLWAAARHLGDYERAVRDCVAVGGDIDTTAAITGGIVAAHTGAEGVPGAWREAREPLPGWLGTPADEARP